jgi:hypothetical protein
MWHATLSDQNRRSSSAETLIVKVYLAPRKIQSRLTERRAIVIQNSWAIMRLNPRWADPPEGLYEIYTHVKVYMRHLSFLAPFTCQENRCWQAIP